MKKTVASTCAFIFDGDRILLGKFRDKYEKSWAAPGGKLEYGETWEEGIIREVKEETNVDIESPSYLNHGSFVDENMHCLYVNFVAQFAKDSVIRLNDEFSEYGFFSRDQVMNLPLVKGVMRDEIEKAFEQAVQG